MVLTVGDVGHWIAQGEELPSHGRLRFAEFWEVTPELLSTLAPSVVLAPVLARGFDCVDLGARLFDCGFVGRYIIMAPSLPDPNLVLRELRSLFPGLDIDIGAFGSLPGLRSI